MISSSAADTNFVLDYTTVALVYKLTDAEKVLILNAGTGEDVIQAKRNNAQNITAVEQNPVLNSLLLNELAGDTDSIYYSKYVELVELSPRTFLQADSGTYDIIKLPMLGAFGGTSGTQAISEEYLLTVEAFELILNRLTEEGFVSVTSWLDYPYRNPLRILATITKALERKGINEPGEHIISIRSWSTITYLVKKTKLDSIDITATKKFSNELSFDPVILPGITSAERTKYNLLQDDEFFTYIDTLKSEGSEKFIEEYTFRVSATTDNKPYFSQFLKWKNLADIKEFFGSRSIPFFELGYLVVVLTLAQIIVISFVLIILPLFKLGWKGGSKWRTVLYFTGLGTGYMFIEIVLIQKFILYFGNPILSASAVISFMLICSGTGSYVSHNISGERNKLLLFIGAIISLLLLYMLILAPLLNVTIQLHTLLKAAISFLIIGLPAFLMGFPFPIGIKKLDRTNNKQQIPWAWGINGCFSVISAPLATIVSVELGFLAVFLLAAFAYGLTFVVSLQRA